MAAAVSGVHIPDDKKKRKSTDVACFSDALEQAEEDTMDLKAMSTAGSTSLTGSASNVVSAGFEMNILKILAEIQAGQKNQSEKTDKNMAGINGVSASVETLKSDLTKTNNRMDSTCKTLATVTSRILKMEEVLAKCSMAPAPQFWIPCLQTTPGHEAGEEEHLVSPSHHRPLLLLRRGANPKRHY